MNIVTWNVNSLRARYERVVDFLDTHDVDVMCIQETKCKDDNFPEFDLRTLGYDVCHYGLSQYNGVAIISKEPHKNVVAGLNNNDDPYINDGRVIRCDVGEISLICVYVPNGRDVDSEHYEMKLRWYGMFVEYLRDVLTTNKNVVVVGDFNIAPTDEDVFDINELPLTTHITRRERNCLREVLDVGFVDSYRHLYPTEQGFTFWDYRGGNFHLNRGMRIDLCLVSHSLAGYIKEVSVDRDSRKGEKPSDHAAVLLRLDF